MCGSNIVNPIIRYYQLKNVATTCPAALSIRLAMQKTPLRNQAINPFFCYANRILRTTGQAVQLIIPGYDSQYSCDQEILC